MNSSTISHTLSLHSLIYILELEIHSLKRAFFAIVKGVASPFLRFTAFLDAIP